MGDWRFRVRLGGGAMHEGWWTEGWLARQARIDEHALACPEGAGVARRQFHEDVVRMLAVHQRLDAIGGLACSEKQGIATLAHQRVGADGAAELERASVIEAPLRGAHHHAGNKPLVVSARTVLRGVDKVDIAVGHQHPVADMAHYHVMRGSGRPPGSAAGVAGHGVVTECAAHVVMLGAGFVMTRVAGRCSWRRMAFVAGMLVRGRLRLCCRRMRRVVRMVGCLRQGGWREEDRRSDQNVA